MNEFPHTDSKGTYYQSITLCKVQRISFWKLPRLFLFIIFIFYSYQPFKFWPTYFWSKSKVKTWIYCWYQYKVKFKYKAIQIFRDTPYNGLAQFNPMEAELYQKQSNMESIWNRLQKSVIYLVHLQSICVLSYTLNSFSCHMLNNILFNILNVFYDLQHTIYNSVDCAWSTWITLLIHVCLPYSDFFFFFFKAPKHSVTQNTV